MESLDLDFFVHAGDILYYDNLAKNKSMAHYHWDRMFSLPTNKSFHAQVTSYFEKDDHDAWFNDSYRGIKSSFMGDFTFDQGLAVFRQEMPIKDKTYRTFRWGKDLQIWLVEGEITAEVPIPKPMAQTKPFGVKNKWSGLSKQ